MENLSLVKFIFENPHSHSTVSGLMQSMIKANNRNQSFRRACERICPRIFNRLDKDSLKIHHSGMQNIVVATSILSLQNLCITVSMLHLLFSGFKKLRFCSTNFISGKQFSNDFPMARFS